ncbi:DUF6029 family protein [Bacteroidota bacterium]
MQKGRIVFLIILTGMIFGELAAQEDMFGNSRISGNFQVDMQTYKKDSLIGAPDVDEKILSNGFLWLTYTSNNFNAGLRYENYLNPILGIDKRYKGSGIAYRYAEFTSEFIDVTAGNFYEQFGSGIIFRSYQEYALGYDNAMEGLRVRFRPAEGIEIKGIIGKQRKFWTLGEGIVRGGDAGININESMPGLLPDDYQLSFGGSVVSKFQQDQESRYNLPENVLMWSGRFSLTGSEFSLDGEYGCKNPDPAAANDFNFNPGNALLINASYFTSGFGASLNFHRNDNMDIRSDRNELGNQLLMNFLPPLTKQHTYALASMYPYATQLNGEAGFQAEAVYTIPRKTIIGGQYGTNISLNYSQVNSIVKNPVDVDTITGQVFTYDSPFFEFGDDTYFREFNLEITRKFSKEFKTVFTYLNQLYDRDVLESEGSAHYGKVHSDILIADLTYKFTSKYALRTEIQHMWATQDSIAEVDGDKQYGDWLAVLMEMTISPNWYISLTDQWNYGNDEEDLKIHYITGAVTYVHDATRVSLGFGRQREGIICVGGVCRQVPASNGFFMSISSSF